jgi:hypothetical protein
MSIRTIVLFCGVAFLAPTAAAGALDARPAEVVHLFYGWYFSPGVKGRAFNHISRARPFLTRSFGTLLARVHPYEEAHGAVLEADPFIDAQIEASSVTLGSSFTQNGAAMVTVTVHYPKDSSVGHVKVQLIRTADAGWRIDDIVGATGGSLRKTLEHNLK